MKLWLKRYLILLLCLLIALMPTLAVLKQFEAVSGNTGRIIFWSVFLGVAALFFGLMTFFMIRGKRKKK